MILSRCFFEILVLGARCFLKIFSGVCSFLSRDTMVFTRRDSRFVGGCTKPSFCTYFGFFCFRLDMSLFRTSIMVIPVSYNFILNPLLLLLILFTPQVYVNSPFPCSLKYRPRVPAPLLNETICQLQLFVSNNFSPFPPFNQI